MKYNQCWKVILFEERITAVINNYEPDEMIIDSIFHIKLFVKLDFRE